MNLVNKIFKFGLFLLIVLLFPLIARPAFAQKLSDVVVWTDSLQLEEPKGVYTVAPEVRIDSSEIIVTDLKESEVRIYTHSGKFKTAFGKKGNQAPGALNGPTAALRLSSGQFLVPDMLNGNISLFDEEGNFIERHQRVVVRGNLVHNLSGDNVLLIGLRKSNPGSHPLLHHFSPITGKIEKSFFPHPAPIGSYGNYLTTIGRIAIADVRGEIIAAAFSIFDTLYFYNSDGTLRQKLDLQLSHFQKLEKPDREISSRERYEKKLTTHSRMTGVFWINDQTLLLQYRQTTDLEPLTVRSYLAAVTRDGNVLFEISEVPELLAVDPENQKLYFDDPDHDAPNHWIVGRLKDNISKSRTGR